MAARRKRFDYSKLATSLPVLVAAASIVWGASKIDSRVASIETWIVENKNTQVELVKQASNQERLEKNQQIIMHDLEVLREANNVGKKDKAGF